MYFKSDDDILALARGLMDLSLPKSQWTHAAHFATALWLIAFRPDLDPRCAMPGFIRAYNEATGVANTDTSGYHERLRRPRYAQPAIFSCSIPAALCQRPAMP